MEKMPTGFKVLVGLGATIFGVIWIEKVTYSLAGTGPNRTSDYFTLPLFFVPGVILLCGGILLLVRGVRNR